MTDKTICNIENELIKKLGKKDLAIEIRRFTYGNRNVPDDELIQNLSIKEKKEIYPYIADLFYIDRLKLIE